MKRVYFLVYSLLCSCINTNPPNANSAINYQRPSGISIEKKGETELKSAIDKMGAKDYDGALSDCNEAISINPYFGESYQIRGAVKIVLEDYLGAIKDCNKAIDLKCGPKFLSAAYLWRGVAKYQLGDHTSGCGDLRKAAELENEQAYLFIGTYCE